MIDVPEIEVRHVKTVASPLRGVQRICDAVADLVVCNGSVVSNGAGGGMYSVGTYLSSKKRFECYTNGRIVMLPVGTPFVVTGRQEASYVSGEGPDFRDSTYRGPQITLEAVDPTDPTGLSRLCMSRWVSVAPLDDFEVIRSEMMAVAVAATGL
jgi:hypothetical protein